MAKAKRNIGQEILDGLRELKSGEYGRVINVPDVASIRGKCGLSQARFAVLLGVSMRTLLMVTDRNPHALREDA